MYVEKTDREKRGQARVTGKIRDDARRQRAKDGNVRIHRPIREISWED